MKKILASILFGLLCAAWVVGCGSGNNNCNGDQVSINNQCYQSCGNVNGQQNVMVNNQCISQSQAQAVLGVGGSGQCPALPAGYPAGYTPQFVPQYNMCCLFYNGQQTNQCSPAINSGAGGAANCQYPHFWNGQFCQ